MSGQPCAVGGCDRDAWARGWCQPHYARWWRTGELHEDIPLGAHMGPHARKRAIVEDECAGPRCARHVANYADTPPDRWRWYCSQICYHAHRSVQKRRQTVVPEGMWRP